MDIEKDLSNQTGEGENTISPKDVSVPNEAVESSAEVTAESQASPEAPGEKAEQSFGDGESNDHEVVAKEERPAAEPTTEAVPAIENETSEPLPLANHDEEGKDSAAEEEEEEIDYSILDYKVLYELINGMEAKIGSAKLDGKLRALRSRFLELFNQDREEAFKAFAADGGTKEDFDYHPDAYASKFDEQYKKVKDLLVQYHKDFEKRKEENLKTKEGLLEKLRQLIDDDETNTSIEEIKAIQEQWKTVGPIPSVHNKTIWANYNALLDRYYDKRSIYFELKELDRKKNLGLKTALCEKAEALLALEDVREAVQKLNELHDEYKHVGPVPRDQQEVLWTRFKAASDEIYKKRRDYQDVLKEEYKENLDKKLKVVALVEGFTSFDSNSINEWNNKTKELLAIQKEWEGIGLMPKENAKEVNKKFWAAFKLFFSNKSQFFKKLEGLRKENLERKEKLIAQAEELKDSEDFKGTASRLKKLQSEWREIGPVPEKVKEDVYKRFKSACDYFFDKRRAQGKEAEKEYVENLKSKEEICDQLSNLKEGAGVEQIIALQDSFAKVGFVPRESMKTIQHKFDTAVEKGLETVTVGMSEAEKEEISNRIQVNMLSNSPAAQKKVERKQVNVRKQISELENNISTWKNNLAFFANSKTADKLKVEFDKKIEDSENELNKLKKQLRLLNSVK